MVTVLESAFEQLADAVEEGTAPQYDYNLCIDISLDDTTKTVQEKHF
jgi:hypothetical protein